MTAHGGQIPPAKSVAKPAPRLLAICSSGGHWQQMMLIRSSFDGFAVTFATTQPGLAESAGIEGAITVSDFNAQQPLKTLFGIWSVVDAVLRVRPRVVVSTGAGPGLVALCAAKVTGSRTIWIDSVANAERLSLSGRLAGRLADHWITQWPHLAKPDGPTYMGAVL